MADIQQKQVRRFGWVSPSGENVIPSGVTADELKIQQIKPGSPSIAPIAQRAPVEFLTPSTSSEDLRLTVPTAANPYATPLGPRHDHVMIRKAMARLGGDIGRMITTALKAYPAGNADGDKMRASLAREHKMFEVLEPLQQMTEEIYAQMIGNQQG